MIDSAVQKKWDKIAKNYSLASYGAEKRWKPWKKELFGTMGWGKILFLAVGTGLDFQAFPPNRDIVGIDISPNMLEQAQKKASLYSGKLELKQMDALHLEFEDNSFDQVFTSCTFCSVPTPIDGLKELHRVLKPGGELKMFEHTSSQVFPFKQMLQMMDPISKKFGPSVNRDTVNNVQQAGFQIQTIRNIYLDIVKTIEATTPT